MCWFLISKQQARALPHYSSTRQNLRQMDLLQEEKGSLKQLLEREVLTVGMTTSFPTGLC